MHDYSNVDVIPLSGQQIKTDKRSTTILSLNRENDGKKFSLHLKDGKFV